MGSLDLRADLTKGGNGETVGVYLEVIKTKFPPNLTAFLILGLKSTDVISAMETVERKNLSLSDRHVKISL